MEDYLKNYNTKHIRNNTITLTYQILDDLHTCHHDDIHRIDKDALNAAVLYIASHHTNDPTLHYTKAAKLTGALNVQVKCELPFICKILHIHARTHIPRPPLEPLILEALADGEPTEHVRKKYTP